MSGTDWTQYLKEGENPEQVKPATLRRRKSRVKEAASKEEAFRRYDSTTEVTKPEAKEILEARGVKHPHLRDVLWNRYQEAAQHFKIPLNDFLFRAGLRTTFASIEQKKQLDAPQIADGLVLGESGLPVETISNKELHAIWDALFEEPDVTYEQFKQTRYLAKTDAHFLGMELLDRNFSKCHRDWVDNFYPRIKPDGLAPSYTQAQMKDWWSGQVANQPKEYVQLASRSSFKSSTAVVFLISIILQCADTRCLLVSEVSGLSKDFIKALRHFFEEPTSRFARYFPEHQIKPGESSVLTYATPMARLGLPQPAAKAIGMDSSAQGLRANLVLVDDPIGVLTVANEEQRKASLTKYLMLKNVRERGGLVFLVGTPYHPQDLFKTVLDSNAKDSDGSFRSRIDPAFRVKDSAAHKDLLDLTREDVDLLFEEQLPFDELMRSLKSDRRFFLSQQLCQFVEVTETVKLNFDRELLSKAVVHPSTVPAIGEDYILVDSAASSGPRADNSAVAFVRIAPNKQNQKTMYVLDLDAARYRGSELAFAIVKMARKWPTYKTCIIEKPLTWDLLEAEIKRVGQKFNTHVRMYAAPVSHNKGAKLIRLKGLEIAISSGTIIFTGGPWLDGLFNELEKLSGSHELGGYRSSTKRDDMADCLSIGQKYLLPAVMPRNPEEEAQVKKAKEEQEAQAQIKATYNRIFGVDSKPYKPPTAIPTAPTQPSLARRFNSYQQARAQAIRQSRGH
jgi:hypothetical protein